MSKKDSAPRKGLSELEHQVMEILWKRGESTAEQIREALMRRHALKDSTVRTVLRRLKEKGYVRYRLQGKAFVYEGMAKPANVAVRAVRQILNRFCDGSLEQLLMGLVENEMVDPKELEQLARKIARESGGN
jgi:predicted transcriptional regulator